MEFSLSVAGGKLTSLNLHFAFAQRCTQTSSLYWDRIPVNRSCVTLTWINLTIQFGAVDVFFLKLDDMTVA